MQSVCLLYVSIGEVDQVRLLEGFFYHLGCQFCVISRVLSDVDR
jgi:hypothetical protein